MIALLKFVGQNKARDALWLAALEFKRREFGIPPEWVATGAGVDLPKGATGPLGLARIDLDTRPGCLVVGIGDPEKERTEPPVSA
jgi:hypothetical protein